MAVILLRVKHIYMPFVVEKKVTARVAKIYARAAKKKSNRKFHKFSQIVLVKIAVIQPRIGQMKRI
jgi:hypothetical protein